MPQNKPLKEHKPKKTNNVFKYSQLGFQLFAVIGLFTWLGYKMDEWWNNGKPLFLIIMMFLGAFGGFYQLFRSLPKD
ncbi:AtpZ/AtpI family protein [Roseivirga pacifica]|uniref:AtpZ/AtpI family protein n=1 Tax=Roseivirga pacifica TaxID=1267423 RepID=UPI00227CB43D